MNHRKQNPIDPSPDPARQATQHRHGLSVSTKISLGFSVVLALHVSIVIIGHYGMLKSEEDLSRYESLRGQLGLFNEIDRTVAALQRNVQMFAFTGYKGPQVRATELESELDQLLDEVEEQTDDPDLRTSLVKMQNHLTAHCEIFRAVIVDRANRRRIVQEVLHEVQNEFDSKLADLAATDVNQEIVRCIDADFKAAQLYATSFVVDPDSVYVRKAKLELAEAIGHCERLTQETENPESLVMIQNLQELINEYERTVIQMFQATRGYLHLVNVVLAGESEEFRRLAGEIRQQTLQHVEEVAATMQDDSSRQRFASNTFSIVTIILGVLAAWLISRDVAPPLIDIANTFDGLTRGEKCESIPGLDRHDELGRLAAAAQVFKEKAAETERLLIAANDAREELNEVNVRLEEQTELAHRMAQEATEATMAKSQFLANMSHEIRTPMTAILGFSETLADSVNQPEQVAALDTIKRNGEHLLSIINDILDLSKVESGKMTVETLEVCPFELLEEVDRLLSAKASERKISLEISNQGPLPARVFTDPTRLRQILINLIGNSIKFTHDGSVKLRASYRNESLIFDIVDTGKGMTTSQVSKLFQPFTQADSTTTRQYGGTGLGLTISKRFAEMLGGSLELVESVPERGTHFRLTIATGDVSDVEMLESPPRSSAKQMDESADAVSDETLEDCRILLAEDGPDNQRLISHILQKAGAEVVVVENGQLAVAAAIAAIQKSEPFHCVLMDMQMPVMGGYEATRALRSQGYGLPIIALTAYAMDGDREKCQAAGCDDYLTKPIRRPEFLATVNKYANRSYKFESN